jgi:hypothetical protein
MTDDEIIALAHKSTKARLTELHPLGRLNRGAICVECR